MALYTHRAYNYCSNHGGVLQQIPYSISTWGQCRDWCDPIMEADHSKVCQYNADGPTNCWINAAPVGGIGSCTWQSSYGNAPYGAWWFGYETPTPTPTPIAGEWHRDGEDSCWPSYNKVKAYSAAAEEVGPFTTFEDCRDWCDTIMTPEMPLCEWNSSNNDCSIYFEPYAGLSSCYWYTSAIKGAWLADFEPPLPPGIENIASDLDARSLPDQELGGNIENGSKTLLDPNPGRIGIFQTESMTLLSSIMIDLSANRDWSNLDVSYDIDKAAVYLNSTDDNGLSSLPGVPEGDLGDLFMKLSGGLGSKGLTQSEYNADLWGEIVAIDDDNNIMMAAEIEDIELYIWNDPLVFDKDSYDHQVVLNENQPFTTYRNYSPAVRALGNGNFMVAWRSMPIAAYSDQSILMRIFDSEGNLVQDDVVIAAPSNSETRYDPKISQVSDGKVMIVWYDADGGSGDNGIAQLVDIDGNKIGSPFYINPDTHYVDEPDVDVLSDGRFVFVYYDGDTEVVFYRIWDPETSDFVGDPIAIDDYSADDYAGYFQKVAADDQGGFGVFWGGYFDDSVDYYDRVYFQAFDSMGNPLYSSIEDMIISDDTHTQWYWDWMGLKYFDGTYHLAWDTYYDSDGDNDYVGFAYRKVNLDGSKTNQITLDEGNWEGTGYSVTMDIDRNGVPVIVWPMEHEYTGNWNLTGVWNVMPNQNPDRIGYCPDAQSLSEVNEDCANVEYKVIGEDIGWAHEENIAGNVSFMLPDVDKGGVFLDGVPAINIKDFPASQSVTNALNVSWFDLGAAGGGDITFYYDDDDSGYDGTQLPGTFAGALDTNYATLDLSGVPNGTYYIYAVIDDKYYEPDMDYAPYSFIKNAVVTPTPTTTVEPTPSGDTTAPNKVRITDIGLISGVADADYLAYYFTSQTPLIKGNSEALSTVYFTYGSTIYSTTTGSDGKFSITLSNPSLPRSEVSLTYYAKDAAGNKSGERTLKLIIGYENFPQWLKDKLNGDSSVPPILTVSPTVTPKVTITGSITPTVTTSPIKTITPSTTKAEEVIITIRDKDGEVMANTQVQFDGRTMTTDAQGRLILNDVKPGEHQLVINGEVQGITISQGTNDLTAYFGNEQTQAQGPGIEFYLTIFIGGAILIGLGIAFLKKF